MDLGVKADVPYLLLEGFILKKHTGCMLRVNIFVYDTITYGVNTLDLQLESALSTAYKAVAVPFPS